MNSPRRFCFQAGDATLRFVGLLRLLPHVEEELLEAVEVLLPPALSDWPNLGATYQNCLASTHIFSRRANIVPWGNNLQDLYPFAVWPLAVGQLHLDDRVSSWWDRRWVDVGA